MNLNALSNFELPAFRPHPLLRNGHIQTLYGVFFPGTLPQYSAQQHLVTLADGDRIVLHDDCPLDWQDSDPVALLSHGLGGCHQSAYMCRTAERLRQRGIRAFRMDLRGCGAGIELARLPYHSGRSADIAEVLRYLTTLCPSSPLALVGFSLSGNIVLKLAGECGANPPGNLVSVMAVSPPADLNACSDAIGHLRNRVYDRYFARLLAGQLAERRRLAPTAHHVEFPRRPTRLREIDDWFTAPICGFGTAENYYRQSSSAPLLPDIRLPTLILAAADDSLVPATSYDPARLSASTVLRITRHGGHLGYIGVNGTDPDRRWLDWRVCDWVQATTRGAASARLPGTNPNAQISRRTTMQLQERGQEH